MDTNAIRLTLTAAARTVVRFFKAIPRTISAFSGSTPVSDFEARVSALANEAREEAAAAFAKRNTMAQAIQVISGHMTDHHNAGTALTELASKINLAVAS